MRHALAVTVFVTIQLVLFPVTLVGGIVYAVGLRSTRRRWGAASTTFGVVAARWLMHATGGRHDSAAGRLLRAIPGLIPCAAKATMGASILASRLSGFCPALYRYPPEVPVRSWAGLVALRTEFFDRVIEHSLDVAQQVVILGAGFDTRAYGMLRDCGVDVFEVDRRETQSLKRAAIDRAGIDADHVRFVAADFNQKSWIERLEADGLDPAKPTFFLWEGVTYYLEPDAVRQTLAAFRTLPGRSVIAFDYPSLELVQGQSRRMQRRLRRTGEAWTFGISTVAPARPHVEAFLAANGLRLLEWQPVGRDEADAPALGGLVLAVAMG